MKIQEKEDIIKFKANDQTSILEISPETPQFSPNTNLKSHVPKRNITANSAKQIITTIVRRCFKSSIKLSFLLKLSATRCSKTLEIDVATKANGIDNTSFERSK